MLETEIIDGVEWAFGYACIPPLAFLTFPMDPDGTYSMIFQHEGFIYYHTGIEPEWTEDGHIHFHLTRETAFAKRAATEDELRNS